MTETILFKIQRMSHHQAMMTHKTLTKNTRVRLKREWRLVLATLLNDLLTKNWAMMKFQKKVKKTISGLTKT